MYIFFFIIIIYLFILFIYLFIYFKKTWLDSEGAPTMLWRYIRFISGNIDFKGG